MTCLLIQVCCKVLFVFRIAGLNVHRHHIIDEFQLLFGHLVQQSTTIKQFDVAVNVWRHVVSCRSPIGFEQLLNGLMAHNSHKKPMLCQVHVLGNGKVFICNIKPVLDFFLFFHLGGVSACKIRKISKIDLIVLIFMYFCQWIWCAKSRL